MFKKFMIIAMATAFAGATFTGCGKKTDENAQAEPAGIDCAKETQEALIASVKGDKPTEEETLHIIETLQCCKIDDKLNIDKDCPTMKAIAALEKDKKTLLTTPEIAEKAAKHESNAVRAYPASRFGNFWGSKPENVDAVAKAYANEKDPYVLKTLAGKVRGVMNRSQDLGKIIIGLLKSDNDIVRSAAVDSLASPNANQVDGVIDALIPMFNDPNPDIAKKVCTDIGRMGDDKIVEPIVAILNDESKAEMHGACINGLQFRWLDYPNHESTSEAAYKASLDYLNKTPRSENVPAWTAVSKFNSINDKKIDAWKQKATYYKPADLVAAFSAIAKDTSTDWRARQAALNGIAIHGKKADVEALRASIEADPRKNVLQSTFDKALDAAAE